MSKKYRFYTTITVRGYVDVETDDPDEYADYLEKGSMSVQDLSCVNDDELEVDDIEELG